MQIFSFGGYTGKCLKNNRVADVSIICADLFCSRSRTNVLCKCRFSNLLHCRSLTCVFPDPIIKHLTSVHCQIHKLPPAKKTNVYWVIQKRFWNLPVNKYTQQNFFASRLKNIAECHVFRFPFSATFCCVSLLWQMTRVHWNTKVCVHETSEKVCYKTMS